MARPAKPYKEQGWYITRAGGVYKRLCPVADGMAKAKSLLREHLTRCEQESKRSGGRVLPRLTVSELFVLFLQAVEAEKSEDTFLDYQRWCVEFAKKHGKTAARDITKFDAQQFKRFLMTATYVKNKQPPKPYKNKTSTTPSSPCDGRSTGPSRATCCRTTATRSRS